MEKQIKKIKSTYYTIKFGKTGMDGSDIFRLNTLEDITKRVNTLNKQEEAAGFAHDEKHVYRIDFSREFDEDGRMIKESTEIEFVF